jgi:hypothetical protein
MYTIHNVFHLRHIIFNLSHPVFALIPVCCALNEEAANTNFIILVWTYNLPQGKHANHYNGVASLNRNGLLFFQNITIKIGFQDNLDIFMSDMLQKYCSKMQGNLHLAFDEKTNLSLSRRLLHHKRPAAWTDCTKRITKSKVQYLTG